MIVPAETDAERVAVYRLRYEVLVREQGIVADPSIDHARQVVIDPADATGVVLRRGWMDS